MQSSSLCLEMAACIPGQSSCECCLCINQYIQLCGVHASIGHIQALSLRCDL